MCNLINRKDVDMKITLALAMLVLLAGCSGGRFEPAGSFLDPVCMPDGSVSFYQQPDPSGQLGEPRAKREFCAWNKAAAAK
jgi:hypothetical protein